MISVLASQPQYLAHIQPIWDALPDDLKGEVLVGPAPRGTLSEWVIVAGGPDSRRARRSKVVWVEHGAGQSYRGSPQTRRHSAYVGGIGHDHVRLFLAPSDSAAKIWRLEYPKARVEAIGCPKLDVMRDQLLPERDRERTVAFAWHFDLQLLPETRSALSHYNRSLPGFEADLLTLGYRVLGHGHPRWADALRKRYAVLGVEWVPSLGEVLQRASTVITDTSSAGWEAAALGLNTIWLNCPSYRRNVNHGLRFWESLPGPSIDHPNELLHAIRSVTDEDYDPNSYHRWQQARQIVVDRVYKFTDGSSTQRAVDAILDTILN